MDIYYVDVLGYKFTEPTNLGPDINSEYNESFPYSYNDSIYSIPQIKLIEEGSLIFILLPKWSLTVGQQTL